MNKGRFRGEPPEEVKNPRCYPKHRKYVRLPKPQMDAMASFTGYRLQSESTISSSEAQKRYVPAPPPSLSCKRPDQRYLWSPRKEPPDESHVPYDNPGYWADHVKSEKTIRQRSLDKYGHNFYGKCHAQQLTSGGEPYEKDVHGHQTAQKGNECLSSPRGPIIQVKSGIKGVRKRNPHTTSNCYMNGDCPKGNVPGWRPHEVRAPKIAYDYPASGNAQKHNAVKDRVSSFGQHNMQFGDCPKGNVPGWRSHEVRAPKMADDYPASGNAQKHHAAKDHVTSHSSTFGHHSVQFGNQNQISVLNAKTPTSSYDFYLQVRSSARSNSASNTKHPACLDTPKYSSSSSGLYSDVPYKRDGRDELSQKLEGFSLAGLQRVVPLRGLPRREMPPPGVCPKCLNCIGCTCVPRRREHVSEDPEDGPSEELPPWPPQIWCGPSYAGSRHGTIGDIQRLRYRLSRDPEWRTPVNRMYDEMKAVNYSGGKSQHYGDNSLSCGVCHSTREAERGTWFEQLRKGNLFTTGDTRFRSGVYIPTK